MIRARNRRTRSAAPSQPALGRAVASRPRCEPVEIEDPTNAALDLIEAHVRDVLRAGAEHALLLRLKRLLPEQVVSGGAMGRAAEYRASGEGSVSPPPARVGSTVNAEGGDRA